jgi:hypothetical protein
MYKKFIIVKSESLISDRTDQIKNTQPKEFFSLQRITGCSSPQNKDISMYIWYLRLVILVA